MPTHVLDRQKPGAWALEQCRTPPDTAHLWQDLTLALPLWEGAGKGVEDVSGLNLHSYVWGSTPAWVVGELGSGIDFDGTSSGYFRIADPPANYLDGCGALTVEFWMIPHDITGLHGIIAKYRATDGMRSWRIFTNGSEMAMTASTDGVAYVERLTSGAGISIGTLYHVVVQFDAGTLRVYLNGVAQSVTGTYGFSTIFGGTDYLMVGRRYDAYYFNGHIYSVRIWQRVITAQEVSILYDAPFRMYEPDFDLPTLALEHGAGGSPAGPWILAGEVNAGVKELYLSGLTNGISYDVYAQTVDLSGNVSTGCAAESQTPVASAGGVNSQLRRGVVVGPVVPPIVRRYK